MSKENYTFDDLEDILAEFSSKAAPGPEAEPVIPQPEKAPEAPIIKTPSASVVEETVIVPAIKDIKPERPAPSPEAKPQRKRPGSSFEEFEALFSREKLKKEAADKRIIEKYGHQNPAEMTRDQYDEICASLDAYAQQQNQGGQDNAQ